MIKNRKLIQVKCSYLSLTLMILIAFGVKVNATNVYFDLTEIPGFGALPATNRQIVLQQQTPFIGNNIFLPLTDVNGRTTNFGSAVGLINGVIKAPPGQITFQINVTSASLGTVDALTIVASGSSSTFPAGSVAWAAFVSDQRYQLAGSSQSNSFYPLFSNPSNYVQNAQLLTASNSLMSQIVAGTNGSTSIIYSNPASFTTIASFLSGTSAVASVALTQIQGTNAILVSQKQGANGFLTNISVTGANTNQYIGTGDIVLTTNVITGVVSIFSSPMNGLATTNYANGTTNGMGIPNGIMAFWPTNLWASTNFVTLGTQQGSNFSLSIGNQGTNFTLNSGVGISNGIITASNILTINLNSASNAIIASVGNVSTVGLMSNNIAGKGTNNTFSSPVMSNATISDNVLYATNGNIAFNRSGFGPNNSFSSGSLATGPGIIAGSDSSFIGNFGGGGGGYDSIFSSTVSGITSPTGASQATVINGQSTTNYANNALAIGKQVSIFHNDSSIWSDDHNGRWFSTTNGMFSINFLNGLSINDTNAYFGYPLDVNGQIRAGGFSILGAPSILATPATTNSGTFFTNMILSIATFDTNGLATTNYVNTATNGFVTTSITNGFLNSNGVVNLIILTNAIAHTDMTNLFNQAGVNLTNISVSVSNTISTSGNIVSNGAARVFFFSSNPSNSVTVSSPSIGFGTNGMVWINRTGASNNWLVLITTNR